MTVQHYAVIYAVVGALFGGTVVWITWSRELDFAEFFATAIAAVVWPLSISVVGVILAIMWTKDRWNEWRDKVALRKMKGCRAKQSEYYFGVLKKIADDHYRYLGNDSKHDFDRFLKLYQK